MDLVRQLKNHALSFYSFWGIKNGTVGIWILYDVITVPKH